MDGAKNAARDGKEPPVRDRVRLPVLTPPPAVPRGFFWHRRARGAVYQKTTRLHGIHRRGAQIIGAEQTVDLTAVKPVLRVSQTAGGVLLQWTKQGLDGVEIQVDRSAGFGFLAIDTVPDYTDTQALPPPGRVRCGSIKWCIASPMNGRPVE